MYDKDNRYDKNPDYNLVNENGICPVCGKEELNYGVFELEGDGGYYPCSCPICYWGGREWYDMQFANYTDE